MIPRSVAAMPSRVKKPASGHKASFECGAIVPEGHVIREQAKHQLQRLFVHVQKPSEGTPTKAVTKALEDALQHADLTGIRQLLTRVVRCHLEGLWPHPKDHFSTIMGVEQAGTRNSPTQNHRQGQ